MVPCGASRASRPRSSASSPSTLSLRCMVQPLRRLAYGKRLRALHAYVRLSSSTSSAVPLAVGAYCVWGRCGPRLWRLPTGRCSLTSATQQQYRRGQDAGVGWCCCAARRVGWHGVLSEAAADRFPGRQRRRLRDARSAAQHFRVRGCAHAGPARRAPRRAAAVASAPTCACGDGAHAVRLGRCGGTAPCRDPRGTRTGCGRQRSSTRRCRGAARFCVCSRLGGFRGSLESAAAVGTRGNRRRRVQPGSWRCAAVRHLACTETACAAGGRRATWVRAFAKHAAAARFIERFFLHCLPRARLTWRWLHCCRGISSTLCALDALALRGYDVDAVVIIESENALNNADAVRAHLPIGTLLMALPALPTALAASDTPESGVPNHVAKWLDACAPQFRELALALQGAHERRIAAFAAMPSQARAKLWWPFTQHDDVRDADVTVVDGRSGDALLVHDAEQVRHASLCITAMPAHAIAQARIVPLFDACSSWWTQGVSAAMQPRLTRAIG